MIAACNIMLISTLAWQGSGATCTPNESAIISMRYLTEAVYVTVRNVLDLICKFTFGNTVCNAIPRLRSSLRTLSTSRLCDVSRHCVPRAILPDLIHAKSHRSAEFAMDEDSHHIEFDISNYQLTSNVTFDAHKFVDDNRLPALSASQVVTADASSASRSIEEARNTCIWEPTPCAPVTYQAEALSMFGQSNAVESANLLSLPKAYAGHGLGGSRPANHYLSAADPLTAPNDNAQHVLHNKRRKLGAYLQVQFGHDLGSTPLLCLHIFSYQLY